MHIRRQFDLALDPGIALLHLQQPGLLDGDRGLPLRLAPLVIRAIFDVLARLRAEGLTMLLVEQNARAAFRIADRGYALVGGMIQPAGARQGRDDARAAYGFAPLSEEASR